MGSQWNNFLKNLGTWQGSFAAVTLAGEILEDTPSILDLSPLDGDRQTVRLHLRQFADKSRTGEPLRDNQFDFQSLGRHVIFAENGDFSKGAMCFTSMREFVAEFGFIEGDRRLRMVQMYDDKCQFKKLVFIREFREGTTARERPPLTADQLVGTWDLEAWTYRPDFEPPTQSTGQLKIDIHGEELHQSLAFGTQAIASKAQIQGNTLLFPQGRQITLLPDGGSINVPVKLEHRQRFFVEVGWLFADNTRRRIMRNFDDQGNWESSVFITERRVA